MPRGDGTGPMGMGPMTGRAAGYCAGFPVPGFMNPYGGRGYWAWGRGGGRGRRNWFYATGLTGYQRAAMGWPAYGAVPPAAVAPVPPGPGQELTSLKAQAQRLQEALKDINQRIDELQGESQQREG